MILGRYQLEEVLGQGGMGEVWKALDRQEGSHVALKRLWPALLEHASVLRRFRQEVQILQQLQHPHIVQIREFHQPNEEQNALCFSMEWLEGKTLRQRLQEGQIPPWETASILKQIGEALTFAHQKGLIHRDLKPENIFLCEHPRLHVKLLDFGIAVNDSGTRITSYTQGPGAIGTAYYMAPEQVKQEKKLTPKVDIYSCGIMLYEMFVGELPLTGARPISEAIEVQLEQSFGQVRLYPRSVVDAFRGQLDELQQLHSATLRHDPGKRASLADFCQAVESLYRALWGSYKSAEAEQFQQALTMVATGRVGRLEQQLQPSCAMFPEHREMARLLDAYRRASEPSDGAEATQPCIVTDDPVRQKLLSLLARGERQLWKALLSHLSKPPLQHTFSLYSRAGGVAFDAGGDLLAFAEANVARVWSMGDGRLLAVLRGHKDEIDQLCFHPHEPILATSSKGKDPSIRLWVATDERRPAKILLHHQRPARWIGFSPDGASLYSATSEGEICVWNAQTGELQLAWEVEGGLTGFAVDPCKPRLATASPQGGIKLWTPSCAASVDVEGLTEMTARALAFHPNGRWLLLVTSQRRALCWDLMGGKEVASATLQSIPREILCHPLGLIVAMVADRAVGFHAIDGLALLSSMPSHSHAVAYHPASAYLAMTTGLSVELRGHEKAPWMSLHDSPGAVPRFHQESNSSRTSSASPGRGSSQASLARPKPGPSAPGLPPEVAPKAPLSVVVGLGVLVLFLAFLSIRFFQVRADSRRAQAHRARSIQHSRSTRYRAAMIERQRRYKQRLQRVRNAQRMRRARRARYLQRKREARERREFLRAARRYRTTRRRTYQRKRRTVRTRRTGKKRRVYRRRRVIRYRTRRVIRYRY